MDKNPSNIESTVRPLLDAIKNMTNAEEVVLLVKNEAGRHCIGGGNLETAQLVFSIASHMSGALAEQVNKMSQLIKSEEHGE